MIRLLLKGGLGNQMFQYAMAKSIALDRNDELQLDLTFLKCRIPIKDFSYRNYDLDLFEVPEQTTSFTGIKFIDQYAYPIWQILNSKLNKGYIQEPGDKNYQYKPELIKSNKDLLIEGYWNNYKYFEKHETEIRAIFDTDKLYDNHFDAMEEKIRSCNSVSINIRRGDYLNSKHKDIYVYLDKDYYKKAIEIVRNKVDNPTFFVFSYDDPEWIKSQLEFKPEELVIVGKEYAGERFKTYLRLISLCKHNIISNSTFAFWGAYLNRNLEKTIVSPKHWMQGSTFDNPKSWTGI